MTDDLASARKECVQYSTDNWPFASFPQRFVLKRTQVPTMVSSSGESCLHTDGHALESQADGPGPSLQIGEDNSGALRQPIDVAVVETSLRRWVTAGIAVALLATVLMGVLSWRSAGKAADDADLLTHTQVVKTALQTALLRVIDLETGARAFDATGHEFSLKPYFDGKDTIGKDLQTLRFLTADNPAQQRRLDLLKSQTSAKLDLSTEMVATRRRTGALSTAATFTESKKRMDAVRATVLEMQEEESRLLDQREEIARSERRWTKKITSGGTLVGVVFLLLAGVAIRREVNSSARIRGQLAMSNVDLERRVEQRTSVLQETEVNLRAEAQARAQSDSEVRKLNDELELRVRDRTSELEAANKELEAFTYSVSHDLRAPLRHIAGFSRMLAEECGSTIPPEGQRFLQRIQDGVRRMGVLVDDLLNLARIGRLELRQQVTGLDSLVKEVIADLKPDTEGRQVEWKVGNLPYVEGDPALLKQVFHNLLSNALKYSRPRSRGVIEIGKELQDGQPVIFVRDNGVGFNMKHADKLFGVFQRLHRDEDFEGTGVGLATVQRIVQKHGGAFGRRRNWTKAQRFTSQ
jgi:signal transduction histidine kinase